MSLIIPHRPTLNRLVFLDSFRALAALFVVLHHSVVNFYDPAIEKSE
jgi:peptidoglycan/LPS O-acetylase OafA/YrhL